MFNKSDLRKKIKLLMKQMDINEKRKKDNKIHHNLFSEEQWKEASVVGVTVSIGDEIDTYEIITNAWSDGKAVVVPKCIPNEKKLCFYKIESFDMLEETFYGLKEPNPDKSVMYKSEEIDLLIVPGIVFNKEGYRIGYGGGYFDRFLEGKRIPTCSLLYECQLLKEIPYEDYDVPVHKLITEKRTINT
ncbi:5-formyltetrahydrofolate cyclo-ligase [Evansella sp. AB-P1]|uniref:5-formyltetrahydrofolate cyclo-ligase n=1 Tax=Evansella sp. AB-P1 TaxID=3037653 RepID=UPI00241E645B|nr:5-formyltetrahydrofolate cyclo-ligase [Evansella sp. AB-P1]MDG5788747.1 5-formyltetrahydrofolate cyclo-ligase [Evansella sp. AB-P1]